MKKKILLFLILLNVNYLQSQVPVNGGFEDGLNFWTSNGTTGSTNARTGIKALVSASTTSATNTAHLNSTSISIAVGSYAHVLGWAVGSNSFSNASCGGTLNATTNSAATTNIGTVFTRLLYNVQNNTGSAAVFSCRVNSRSSTSGNATQLFWDDVIMYTDLSPTADLVKPVAASGFSNGAILPNTVSFGWTNGTDAATGIQETIILRTTNTSPPVPVMNDQGVYSIIGGPAGPDHIGSDWIILNSTTPATTTYIDNTVAASTAYRYAVIHRDLAYNYSIALVSGIIITPAASPVPVSLLFFTGSAQGNSCLLRWATATETNNRGFEVQRSADGLVFTPIGFVNSQALTGSSNEILNYEFIDPNPFTTAYYRLRQVDIDDHQKLSGVIMIKNEKQLSIAIEKLFPSPAKNHLNILVTNDRDGNAKLNIKDIGGRVVKEQAITLGTGRNILSMDIAVLKTGIYFIELFIKNSERPAVARFFKE